MEIKNMKKYQNQVSMMFNLHKIINKLVNIFYAYIIIFFISIIHLSKHNSEGGKNNAEYIPKRLRKRKPYAITNKYVNKLLQKCTECIWQNLENMQTSMRVKRHKMKAKRMACPITKGKYDWMRKFIIVYPIVAMSTKDHSLAITEQRMIGTDTDSETIGIDNRCSACISHHIEDFFGNPTESKRIIRRFGGTHTRNIMSGTIQWSWLDDDGQKHTFRIPNSYYVPHGSVRLLSPQHWAQTQSKGRMNGTSPASRTYHNRIILGWNDGNNQLTVPISKQSNVATFSMAPGYSKFNLFCQSASIDYEKEIDHPITCTPVEADNEIEDEYANSEDPMKLNRPSIVRSSK